MTDAARHLQIVRSEAPDPLIGQLVDGRYRVESVLGKGGMGLVYRAKHQVLGKLLALKVLKPEVSKDGEVMERFRREAQAASAIGSPHICDVSDFGMLPDGSTYFVMEYLDGPSLTAAMKDERPLAMERVVNIARQLCDALGAAHARGIVHRDLKPDNVHLVPRGKERDFVKVLDFGIAKVGGAAENKKLTQAGQIFGTPHYMSPEQCSGRDVDQRTDVYALGVMLYEMACGHVPFDSDSLMGVLTKHVYELPLPPHESQADVPAGLEAVILKCLAKRPDERYASMAELRAELDHLAQGTTPAAVREQLERAMAQTPPSPAFSAPAPIALPARPEPARKRGWIVAPLALLLLGVIAMAIGFAWPREQPREETPVRRPVPIVNVVPDPEPPVIAPVPDPEPPAPQLERAISISSDPAGALVYDATGALLGNAPLDLPRPAEGELAVYRLAMPGYAEQQITLSSRTSDGITVHLVRLRGRVPTDPGGVGVAPDTTPDTEPDYVIPRDDDLLDPFASPAAPRRPR
jgi:predicted Ser/Thr protein kinase